MRRFFYDTEFMEAPGRMELLSIGVLDEMGCEFYGENAEADLSMACPWVIENVLPHLKQPGALYGSRALLAARLLAFLHPTAQDPVEMWGYYSAYDHVALCWLFGSMVDLPPGMPMLTLDVQQLAFMRGTVPPSQAADGMHNALVDARWTREAYLYLTEVSQRTPTYDLGNVAVLPMENGWMRVPCEYPNCLRFETGARVQVNKKLFEIVAIEHDRVSGSPMELLLEPYQFHGGAMNYGHD